MGVPTVGLEGGAGGSDSRVTGACGFGLYEGHGTVQGNIESRALDRSGLGLELGTGWDYCIFGERVKGVRPLIACAICCQATLWCTVEPLQPCLRGPVT